MTGENEARIPERLVQDRVVVARGGDTLAEVLRWSCAEFDLAAWLQGQEAGSGQDARFLQRVEYLTYPAEWHALGRVCVVQDQPLKLGANRPWRARFEADRADQPLGLGFRDRRTGVSRVGGQRNHPSPRRIRGRHQALPRQPPAGHGNSLMCVPYSIADRSDIQSAESARAVEDAAGDLG